MSTLDKLKYQKGRYHTDLQSTPVGSSYATSQNITNQCQVENRSITHLSQNDIRLNIRENSVKHNPTSKNDQNNFINAKSNQTI